MRVAFPCDRSEVEVASRPRQLAFDLSLLVAAGWSRLLRRVLTAALHRYNVRRTLVQWHERQRPKFIARVPLLVRFHAMQSPALSVLLVDSRPAALWSLSNFLTSAGYDVIETGEAALALAALEHHCPDFVIADWDPAGSPGEAAAVLELCRKLRNRHLPREVHVLLACGTNVADDLVTAMAAGADDFLSRPIVHGELLSRLRTGARANELEHRLSGAGRKNPQTGFYGRPSCLAMLERLIRSKSKQAAACLVIDIDFFRGLKGRFGEDIAGRLVGRFAEHVLKSAPQAAGVFQLGEDRLVIVFAGMQESDAVRHAEDLRQSVATLDWGIEPSPAITCTTGVAGTTGGVSAGDLLATAEQALWVAKRSGRNRCLSAAGMGPILADAKKKIDPLKNAVARDVMTSNPLNLDEHEPIKSALAAMHQCRQSVLPVIDREGKLRGTVSADTLKHRAATKDSEPLAAVLAADAPHYDEQATVQELYEFFLSGTAGRVEIVHEGRPTGFVTRGSLAALGEKIDRSTFAASNGAAANTGDFLVSDLAWIEE